MVSKRRSGKARRQQEYLRDLAQAYGQDEPLLQPRITEIRPSDLKASPSQGETQTAIVEDEKADEEESSVEGSDAESSTYGDDDGIDLNATASSLMAQAEAERMSPWLDHGLDLLIWLIPFSALFVLLDIMIQHQYALNPTLLGEMGRLAKNFPFLVGLIWWSTIKPALPQAILQPLLLILGTVSGSAFLWIFTMSPFKAVVQRVPPLGTIWIFCIVKLDLQLCVLCLIGVAGFLWYKDLDIFAYRF